MRPIKVLLAMACLLRCLAASAQTNAPATVTNNNRITRDSVIEAEKIIGLSLADTNLDTLARGLRNQLRFLKEIRAWPLSNSVPSAMLFNPIPVGFKFETVRKPIHLSPPPRVKLPANMDDLAFYSLEQLGALIKSRQLTSEQLTRFYLERLRKYGPKLRCVVTLTDDLALEQARRVDREIAAGKYRGPLDGIPYGAKDLLATKGIRTTWGTAPYTNQVFDDDAAVIKRLNDAGAVLVAKLSLGELAMGDQWFGGQTRNPWDPSQGSGGSSAGPGAATAAGLVAFAIGTETRGSIVDPCTRCGLSGLRPTYGRVSRTGAMTLSASNDKIGPMCRTVEDCAIVFNAIYGPDGIDQTVYDAPFNYDSRTKLKNLRIGYLKNDFERAHHTNDLAAIAKLQAMGVNLVPVELPDFPVQALDMILSVEAAASFDELTLSGRDDLMAQQGDYAWPGIFRRARFVPAVEYIQANRIRYELVQAMAKMFRDFDVIVSPSFDGDCNYLSNQSGYPCVVVPDGFTGRGMPTSISFIGNLFGEARALEAAKAYQDATDFHQKHPDLSKLDSL